MEESHITIGGGGGGTTPKGGEDQRQGQKKDAPEPHLWTPTGQGVA